MGVINVSNVSQEEGAEVRWELTGIIWNWWDIKKGREGLKVKMRDKIKDERKSDDRTQRQH